MKYVYCANCGKQLAISRKAIPQHRVIIDICEYHECLEEPAEYSFTEDKTFEPVEGKNEFNEKIEKLTTPAVKKIRAKEDESIPVKSTAPENILEKLQNQLKGGK